jgi:SAM-dependent methyltransferase
MVPLDAIDRALPATGTIADLGCGQGVIAAHLALNPARTVIGIDSDAARIAQADQSYADTPNLRFVAGDIRQLDLSQLDGVVVSDVLHHVPPTDRQAVLELVHQALAENGVFVIKEVDRDEFVRGKLSRLWDTILYPKEQCFEFFTLTNLEQLLTGTGFAIDNVSRESRFFPGSTTLLVCRRR